MLRRKYEELRDWYNIFQIIEYLVFAFFLEKSYNTELHQIFIIKKKSAFEFDQGLIILNLRRLQFTYYGLQPREQKLLKAK